MLLGSTLKCKSLFGKKERQPPQKAMLPLFLLSSAVSVNGSILLNNETHTLSLS